MAKAANAPSLRGARRGPIFLDTVLEGHQRGSTWPQGGLRRWRETLKRALSSHILPSARRRPAPRSPDLTAVAAVQRPLRRIRISAHRRVRRRGPLRHGRASSRQAAERQGDQPFLRRLLRAIRAHRPNTEILLRADSHYCALEVLDWCRASGVDYILGVAPTTTLRRHVESLEASVLLPFEIASVDASIGRGADLEGPPGNGRSPPNADLRSGTQLGLLTRREFGSQTGNARVPQCA